MEHHFSHKIIESNPWLGKLIFFFTRHLLGFSYPAQQCLLNLTSCKWATLLQTSVLNICYCIKFKEPLNILQTTDPLLADPTGRLPKTHNLPHSSIQTSFLSEKKKKKIQTWMKSNHSGILTCMSNSFHKQ